MTVTMTVTPPNGPLVKIGTSTGSRMPEGKERHLSHSKGTIGTKEQEILTREK